jgi:transposase
MDSHVQYSPELKAIIALEALKGAMSVAELASKYEIRPSLVVKWKRQARNGMVRMFSLDGDASAGLEGGGDKSAHKGMSLLSTEERTFFNGTF